MRAATQYKGRLNWSAYIKRAGECSRTMITYLKYRKAESPHEAAKSIVDPDPASGLVDGLDKRINIIE